MASSADLLTDLLQIPAPRAGPRVALLDFDDIQPLQLACLEHLCCEVQQLSGARCDSVTEVHSYPDRAAELQAVAVWVAGQHRTAPERSLGIILADAADRGRLEYLLRREFDCLGQNYTALPVNFSTGISLARAPVVRDALLALSTVAASMPLGDLLALLRSRFIAGENALGDPLVTVLQQLYRDGRRKVALARLRYLCQRQEQARPAAAEALMATENLRLRRRSQYPSAWAAVFGDVLRAWGWPGATPLDSLEYQQVELWYDTLETFAGYDELHGELVYADALALLRRLCQGQISQPQTADTPIQVMGPLEGAGLQFDHVWWVGLQGSRWPAASRPNPFLPVALQRRHDMPHASAEREWRYAEALLRQYRGGSPRLTISYARHVDGTPDLPSALVSGFPRTEHTESPMLPADWTARQASSELTPCSDATGPAVRAAERKRVAGGSAILAAQAACPFQGFAAHRLGLEVLQPPVTGLSAAERGKLLHEALYLLWGEIGDSATLKALDDSAQARVVREAVEAAVSALPGPLRLLAGEDCLTLERLRLQSLLQEWLEVERRREPFSVLAREEERTIEFAGIPLRLRIDRIDAVAGDQQLLIDYKSGRCRLGDWLGDRVREPQLPLYGIVSRVGGVCFGQVRARDCRFVGVASMGGTPGVADNLDKALSRYAVNVGNWEGLVDRWRMDLEQLAAEFLAGQAQVAPQPGACDYCGYASLCRIGLEPGDAS
jgi:probable DNA repair protein